MSLKEKYCHRILKTYSLIVDFNGTPPRKNVPAPIKGETYKQWKKRVLGNDVTDITLYGPIEPDQKTKIRTLQNEANAEHLERMFRAFEKIKDKQKSTAVEEAVSETERMFSTFPKDTLKLLTEELGVSLELSVRQFFDRFLNSKQSDIDTEKLLRDLILTYNNVVHRYREQCKTKPPEVTRQRRTR
ncbi:MAG: hypothetical protein ACOYOS_13240 [Syntrophales bacterium]